MAYAPINLAEKFARFSEPWSPKIIARLNDYDFKLAKLRGGFVWHRHTDTDEAFLVVDGALRIDFRDGAVTLRPGEMFVVPRGVEHRPWADGECRVLLIEPSGTLNTGAERGALTVDDPAWV